LVRLSAFLTVCLLGTVALWAVFADLRFDEGHT
jgi:phospholipid/cholesterol/gamma-HCH transport system substrate-binding protein